MTTSRSFKKSITTLSDKNPSFSNSIKEIFNKNYSIDKDKELLLEYIKTSLNTINKKIKFEIKSLCDKVTI